MGKIALVLSGGGFKGAFQLGALEVIRNNWHKLETKNPVLKFDVVSGVSTGALTGLLVAQNKLDDLARIWDSVIKDGVGVIYNSDFIDTRFGRNTLNPELRLKIDWKTIRKYFPDTTKNILWNALFNRKAVFHSFDKEFRQLRSLADNSPLLDLLRKYAKKEYFTDCAYQCGYVSLETGDYYSVRDCDFETDEDFAKGVLASTTMPIIWPPVDKIHVHGAVHFQCVDGGVRSVSPLRSVIEFIKNDPHPGDYTIIIINCSTGKIEHEGYADKGIGQIAIRALSEIATTEIFNNDIRDFVIRNYFIEQVRKIHPDEIVYDYDFVNNRQGKPLTYFKSIIIQPDSNKILGNSLTANEQQVKTRISHGREKARLALNIHLEKGSENKTTVV